LPETAMNLPTKFYFTFKFFSFKEIQTETVLLRLPPELQNDPNSLNTKIIRGQQYYLQKLKYV